MKHIDFFVPWMDYVMRCNRDAYSPQSVRVADMLSAMKWKEVL
jgi:hypothetical protein